ncbi:unnamed protein product, partial [Tetraodon nigroviridis]
SLAVSSFSDSQFDSYVLQPVEDGFRTLDGKAVQIQDRQVLLGSGFPALAPVPILFDETFYNDQEQSYSVLCISRPIEVDPGLPEPGRREPGRLPPSSLQDVRDFLGPHAQKLDKLIQSFCQAFRQQERRGLRHHIDSVHALYTRCLQCLLRESRLKLLVKEELQMNLLKQAVETYVHHRIHDLIFTFVGTLEASQVGVSPALERTFGCLGQFVLQSSSPPVEAAGELLLEVSVSSALQDAAFNKTSRSLQELQQKDLGVTPEFRSARINLSRAKRELSRLNQQTAPLLKLLCLRRVVLTAVQSPRRTVRIEAVGADDLLSVVLYLLVKTEIPNWMANLSYIRNFCFSRCSQDELSYCLSTFEAAVEYINLGRLKDTHADSASFSQKLLLQARMSQLTQNATPTHRLFEHIAKGNKEAVEELLSEAERDEELRLCHPLCSCDLCDLQLSGCQGLPPAGGAAGVRPDVLLSCCRRWNDPSVVTPSSRDDRGYTPLHLAAACGQSQLIDLLVCKGASVNATDYHGLTPLHLACQRGHQGVTVSTQTHAHTHGHTDTHTHTQLSTVLCLQLLLLHYQANTDAQDNNGNTPLLLACTYGHEDCVKALVYYDMQTCHLDLQNDKGDAALHLAARWGYEGIIQVLLENGADAHLLNRSRASPLQCALNAKSNQNGRQHTRSGFTTSDHSSRRSSVSSTSSLGSQVQPEGERVRHREDSVHALYTRCLQCLLRESRLAAGRSSASDQRSSTRLHLLGADWGVFPSPCVQKLLVKEELQMNLLKQAVEFVLQSSSPPVEAAGRCLQQNQPESAGAAAERSGSHTRVQVCSHQPVPSQERAEPPQPADGAAAQAAVSAPSGPHRCPEPPAVGADDLLSVVLYLLVKTEIPNWMANLSYIRNFCFSRCSQDELSYCLSTFEAAVECQGLPPAGGAAGVRPDVLLSCCRRWNDPSVVTPSSRDDRGYTPLHLAAACGEQPLSLPTRTSQDNNGNTPLLLACTYGHEDCVKALVYYDMQTCHLDLQNDKGDAALHLAARWGYEGIIQVLLENGADAHLLNRSRASPLQCALNAKTSDHSSRRSSVSSTSSLGSQVQPEGERVRHREVEKLLRAVADADVEMVRFLLEWTDEEEEDEEQQPQTRLCHPLCQCPSCSPAQKTSVLQAGVLGVNSCNVHGFTPLHVAALHGHSLLVRLLLRHGAAINARTNHSATPLHLASQNSHVQVSTILLGGTHTHTHTLHTHTHTHTYYQNAHFPQYLFMCICVCQSDAQVNVANLQGNAALHEAVRRGHLALVELLLRGKASASLKNRKQRTPLDCAY